MVRERSARRYTGNKSPCDGVGGGKKRFNLILQNRAGYGYPADIVNSARDGRWRIDPAVAGSYDEPLHFRRQIRVFQR
jgi:hypothetical protein